MLMKMRKDLVILTMSLIYQMVFLTRFFLHTLIIGGDHIMHTIFPLHGQEVGIS
ncbi:hypothetical protein Hanom_Chr03g00253651 [Helianthus anomalus]